MDTTVYEKLLAASIRFVSYRPRSESEIRDFLAKKMKKRNILDATVVQKVVDRLTELEYVDDVKFAAWWVEQRQIFKPKGRRLIAQELKAKGVKIEEVDMTIDEKEAAKNAVQKKLVLWEKLPPLERKKKLFDFLTRRGFSYDTIDRVIDGVAEKE